MKSKFFKLGLAAVAAITGFQAYAAPVFVQLDNNSGTTDFKTPYTEIYVNQTWKINDRYSFTPELVTNLNYTKGTNGERKSPNLQHILLRLSVSDKGLGQLGDGKLGITYQYVAPTVRDLQQQGSLGVAYLRPQISYKMGSAEFVVRNRVSIFLQRKAYSLTTPTQGNPLLANLLEFIPGYDFGNGFAANLYIADQHTFLGAPSGSSRTNRLHRFWTETEVGYTAEQLGKTYFGLVYLSDTRYGGDGNSFKLFTKASSSFSLKISRTFP